MSEYRARVKCTNRTDPAQEQDEEKGVRKKRERRRLKRKHPVGDLMSESGDCGGGTKCGLGIVF